MKRNRRMELIARAKFLAGMWLEADTASADCWDGYSFEESELMLKTIRTIADKLIRGSGGHGEGVPLPENPED